MATKSIFKASTPRKRTVSLANKVIVQILPALGNGGVERGTIEVAAAITDAGGRAVVVSNGGVLMNRLRRAGGEHYKLPVHSKNPFKWGRTRRQLELLLHEVGADLVHIRSRAPAWIAMPVAKAMRLPVVTTIHGRWRQEGFFKNIYNRKMLKSDRIIAISQYVQRQVLDAVPGVVRKMKVIHRGVDIDMFSPNRVSAERTVRMADRLGIPDDVPVIMLPARPRFWKGAHALIEAAALIDDDNFVVFLVGALDGSPKFEKELNAIIDREGMTNRVHLYGMVNDMPAALMLADVVAMPSVVPEPFGRVAIEASAMGRPVVAFNHGGARESVIHGKTGWLAEPDDVASLAECLKTALKMTVTARKKLSAVARKHVKENFSTGRMCADTIKVYTDLLKNAPRRRRR